MWRSLRRRLEPPRRVPCQSHHMVGHQPPGADDNHAQLHRQVRQKLPASGGWGSGQRDLSQLRSGDGRDCLARLYGNGARQHGCGQWTARRGRQVPRSLRRIDLSSWTGRVPRRNQAGGLLPAGPKGAKNPGAEDGSCTSSPAGGPTHPCAFSVNVFIIPTYIPAGSTVTVADTFTVGRYAGLARLGRHGPGELLFRSGADAVPFTCPHGSLSSFAGMLS